MAKYRVRTGYCLHLPAPQSFSHPGEELDLDGNLEQEILKTQGWKVEQVLPEPEPVKQVDEPPRDRAIKKAKAETR